MTSSDYDPASEGAETDFARRMSYGDYLALDAILGAQHPLSEAHDEMLFIIQHQTTELWMRLAIHELSAARRAISQDEVQPAMKMLARMSRIFEQLNGAWDVLRTMTPSEYTRFRSQLGQSSGFQSRQYRLIEFLLGNRNPAMLKPFAAEPEVQAVLAAELARPSLYDEAVRLLARRGFPIAADRLDRDWSATTTAHPDVEAAWAAVYADTGTHWDLYELAEKLVDLDYRVQLWRFGHLKTVERVIGFKTGTGGTAGVGYLAKVLETPFFPDLSTVRTKL